MAKKITGFFLADSTQTVYPYEALIPDDVYSVYDINSVICNWVGLDMATINITDVDEYNYQTLKKACLYQSLFEINELDSLLNKVDEIAAASPQGKVFKIWLDSMQTITRFHSKAIALQTAMGWSDAFVKAFWIRAEEIQSQDI